MNSTLSGHLNHVHLIVPNIAICWATGWPASRGSLLSWLATNWPISGRLTGAIDALAKRIGDRTRQVAPALLSLPGWAELTAAKIVGESPG